MRPIWQELKTALENPGDFQQHNRSEFCIPYVSAHYSDVMTAYDTQYFVANTQVKLYATPKASSALADISCEFVQLSNGVLDRQPNTWAQVETSGGLG